MPTILVIDDDPLLRARLEAELDDCAVVTAKDAADGLAAFDRQPFDVVLLDVMLPDFSGFEVFRKLATKNAKTPVIFVTFREESDVAIEAMQLGAFDYLVKPLEIEDLRQHLERAVEACRLMRAPVSVEDTACETCETLIGRSPAMREVYKAIGRVANTDVTVLIQGETGTGKELVARAIYQFSHRRERQFLAVNCAAIPEPLLESELFGHERGAFTGADQRRIGKFEQCTDGTLFLDEIGDMSLAAQSKILRVLQEQTFQRVGGCESLRTNVRLVAATHRNLEHDVQAGRFREDLYYRLSGFTVRLPALRERLDDLPLLLRHFLTRFRSELGKEVTTVAPETMELLTRYPWPGNVREFQSVLRHGLLHSTGTVLLAEALPARLRGKSPVEAASDPAEYWNQYVQLRLDAGITRNLLAEAQSHLEYQLIKTVLSHTGGNKLRAAGLLGITRNTLRKRMQELGIA